MRQWRQSANLAVDDDGRQDSKLTGNTGMANSEQPAERTKNLSKIKVVIL